MARLKLDGAGAADLKYASLLGGASDDNLWGVAFDPANPQNVVVVGESWSDNYPTTAGVFKPNNPPFSALFPSLAGIITKFNFPATGGGTLAWSSYFGSEGFERAGEGVTDVAINSAGEIILTGRTERSLFPTTRGAYDRYAMPARRMDSCHASAVTAPLCCIPHSSVDWTTRRISS